MKTVLFVMKINNKHKKYFVKINVNNIFVIIVYNNNKIKMNQ